MVAAMLPGGEGDDVLMLPLRRKSEDSCALAAGGSAG